MSATTELAARAALWWLDNKPFSKEAKARRKAKRAARKAARRGEAVDEVAESFNVQTDEVSMNNPVAIQIVLAVLRHAMTAVAPLGVTVSDDWLVQTAALLVGVAGLVWSGVRKWQAAKGE